MNKCTLTPIAMCTFFLLISLLFSCSKDSHLLVDYVTRDHIAIDQQETDPNKGAASKEMDATPIKSPFPYCQADPNPIGGGVGYTEILTPADATIYIKTFTSIVDFKNIIENAPKGAIIYIDDALSIDLTGLYDQTGSASIRVPAEVTIASGRGLKSGALIFTNDVGYWGNKVKTDEPLFRVAGNNVRFTGIRLQGPSQDLGSNVRSEVKNKRAISINGYDGLEMDNCELYGWPFAGIQIGGENASGSFNNNKIHHNNIYNNRQKSLGYGVLIFSGYALISKNIFAANRHDIAAGGQKGSGYEASCNLIKSGGVGHNFDMHAVGPNDGTPNAGSFIFIHHNDFEDVGAARYKDQGKHNITIRGRPEIQCRIENNRFKHSDPLLAIRQINKHGGYGNMLVWNNIYNKKDYLGWYVKKKWLKTNASNFLNLVSSNDDLMKSPKSGSDYTYNYAFGDYNGDGHTDIFKLENGILYTLPLNTGSTGPQTAWKRILKTERSFADIRFGFYDDDDRTDIIVKDGQNINISSGANSPWEAWRTTPYALTDMQEGDFNGDGITDLFLSKGSKWEVSSNSKGNWQTLKVSDVNPTELKLGYFDNNNISDVMKVEGTSLMVSYDGTSSWTTFGNTPFEISDLEVVDFNGDNLSDIIQPKMGKILINGDATWQQYNTDKFPINSFPYGNF